MDEKPKSTKVDTAFILAKAGISAIPLVGGPAAEIFAAIITPPIVKRRDEWVQSLAERLKILEERVADFRLEDLASNEQFVTAVLHTTITASRNHQQEKLEALRNAVLNIALRYELDENLQQIFLNYVDDLTVSHLKVLTFFNDPEDWIKKNHMQEPLQTAGLSLAAHETVFSDLREKGVLDQLITDLRNRGLLNPLSLSQLALKWGEVTYDLTEIGHRFLNFITAPVE